MTPYQFHDAADAEALEAAAWYERQASLGREFLDPVMTTIEQICGDPSSHQVVRGNIRRRRVPSFPYEVVFEDKPGLVRVIAVAHHHRRSQFWRDRLSTT